MRTLELILITLSISSNFFYAWTCYGTKRNAPHPHNESSRPHNVPTTSEHAPRKTGSFGNGPSPGSARVSYKLGSFSQKVGDPHNNQNPQQPQHSKTPANLKLEDLSDIRRVDSSISLNGSNPASPNSSTPREGSFRNSFSQHGSSISNDSPKGILGKQSSFPELRNAHTTSKQAPRKTGSFGELDSPPESTPVSVPYTIGSFRLKGGNSHSNQNPKQLHHPKPQSKPLELIDLSEIRRVDSSSSLNGSNPASPNSSTPREGSFRKIFSQHGSSISNDSPKGILGRQPSFPELRGSFQQLGTRNKGSPLSSSGITESTAGETASSQGLSFDSKKASFDGGSPSAIETGKSFPQPKNSAAELQARQQKEWVTKFFGGHGDAPQRLEIEHGVDGRKTVLIRKDEALIDMMTAGNEKHIEVGAAESPILPDSKSTVFVDDNARFLRATRDVLSSRASGGKIESSFHHGEIENVPFRAESVGSIVSSNFPWGLYLGRYDMHGRFEEGMFPLDPLMKKYAEVLKPGGTAFILSGGNGPKKINEVWDKDIIDTAERAGLKFGFYFSSPSRSGLTLIKPKNNKNSE